MKCPECGIEMRKGFVEAKNAGSLTQALTQVIWQPEEAQGKLLKKDTVPLKLRAEAYYCDECMKVFAAFDEAYEL